MASSQISYIDHPDVFCYVCDEYTLKENRKIISDFVKRAYLWYFGVRLSDQYKVWFHILFVRLIKNTYDNGVIEKEEV